MIRLMLALCAVALFACSKKDSGDVTVTGDRPGESGCADCRALIGSAGEIQLDTSKLEGKGATLSGARLDLTASTGQSVTLPVADGDLGKADLALAKKLEGMPATSDCKAWGGASANLKVSYKTKSGATGDVAMKVPVKVQDCP